MMALLPKSGQASELQISQLHYRIKWHSWPLSTSKTGCPAAYIRAETREVYRSGKHVLDNSTEEVQQGPCLSTSALAAAGVDALTVGMSLRGRSAFTHARSSAKEECSE